MDAAASRHSDQHAAGQARAGIAFAGARFPDSIRQLLSRSFDPVSVDDDERTPALIVAFHAADEAAAERALLQVARSPAIPVLRVELTANSILIGPLTLAGHVGCASCATARLRAASVSSAATEQSSVAPDLLLDVAGPALIEAIRAIQDDASQSQLLGHVLAFDEDSPQGSLHRLIPLPQCSTCGGARAQPTAELPSPLNTDSLADVVGALDGFFDRRTGIVSDLYIEPAEELGISVPIVATAAPPHILEDGTLHRLPLGWGKGLTATAAILSAMGEAIERYSASCIDPDRVVLARPAELDGEFIDPRCGGLYTDAQYAGAGFPYVRFDADVAHPWIRGRWLSGGEVWIPAALVSLRIELAPDQLFCQGTSNGLAAGTSIEDASLRAVFELIERDAFMSAWLSGTPGCRISVDDSLDPMLSEVLGQIAHLGADIELFTLPTSACGTTALCMALGDGDRYPAMSFGLGCDLDPRAALRQAILELGQTGPFLRRMMQNGQLAIPRVPEDVREMLDHAAYYFSRERIGAFDAIRQGGSTLELRDLRPSAGSSLAALSAQLCDAGIRIATVDVTSADVRLGPFRVVRAVSPDLQPISYGHGLERTRVDRLRRLGERAALPPISPIW